MGDGAYLFDPQGDLRTSQIYPCLVACTDPLAGAIRLDVHPRTPESITLTNVSGGTVDLGEHVLQFAMPTAARDSYVFGYPFAYGTQLAPGETLTVLPGGSRLLNVGLTRQLGRGQYVLPDGGGSVSLRTATDVVTACRSWGRGAAESASGLEAAFDDHVVPGVEHRHLVPARVVARASR